MNDPEQIQRLGFEAWADNLIVNALENLADEKKVELDMEEGDVTIMVRTDGRMATATVRAYLKGKGWQYHDRTIKLKEGGRL